MMRRCAILAAALLLVLCASTAWAASASQRIVSLKPNITEILFALGAGGRVAGVTTYCDYPAQARRIPRVADYVKPFAEKIVALAPDLIIGSREDSSRKSVEMLGRMGFEVRLFSFDSVDATLDSIERIARAVGVPGEGRRLTAAMRRAFNEVRAATAGMPRPRALVVWGHRPLIVAGAGSFMDELIVLAGGVNVVRAGSVKYPHWNDENVIAADPDVIIDMARSTHGVYPEQGRGVRSGQAMETEDVLHREWSRLTTVGAVQHGRIHALDDSLLRAGPRLPHAAQSLANAFHRRGTP